MRIDLIFLLSIFPTMISIILFSRISVNYVERKMKEKNNISSPDWDSGIGARAPMYALIMLFERAARHSFMPQAFYVRSYARKLDKYLASALVISIIFSTAILIYAVIATNLR